MQINWSAFKITPAMQALLVGLVVLLFGALATTADAVVQYATQQGTLNWTVLFAFIGTTFVTTMQAAMAGYVKGHASDIKQSFSDGMNEIKAATVSTTAAAASPLVVIHTAPPATNAAAPTTPAVQIATSPTANAPAPETPQVADLPPLTSLDVSAQLPVISPAQK